MPTFSGSMTNKLPGVGTTIFTIMSKLATENNAINLSQGFPDFPCSEELIELVHKYMHKGFNQYAPMPGILPLREIIAEKAKTLYGTEYNPETEITITAGATQAIYTAISAVIRENDEVIIFEPAYDCYQPAITMNGGKTIYVPMNAPDYQINWEEVKKLVNHRTKMIIINSPHNPTGTVLSKKDMLQLEAMVKNTDIIILSDEVYEHIIFDEQEHQSVARFPSLAERSFIVASFGKTFHATGWKMGYCLAPKNLMAEFRKVHQFLVFSCNSPVQYALAEFLKTKKNYLDLSHFYQQKRELFTKNIAKSRFTLVPSAGTYFQLLGYKNISEEKDTELAKRITTEFGVASIPVSTFYHEPEHNHVLRFCFAKTTETIEKASEILCRI